MNKILLWVVVVIIAVLAVFFYFQQTENAVEPLTLDEALAIAGESVCVTEGDLTEVSVRNDETNTWWIDLAMKEEFVQEGCAPACVVNDMEQTAEVNYRCTGALDEELLDASIVTDGEEEDDGSASE
ncbi:MAG: hypothetical protein ABH822_01900 [Patescibacteria group bacterium]